MWCEYRRIIGMFVFLMGICACKVEKNQAPATPSAAATDVEDAGDGADDADDGNGNGSGNGNGNGNGGGTGGTGSAATDGVAINGQLAVGFDAVNVDTSMAVPLMNGALSAEQMSSTVSAPVTAGQISISIPTEAPMQLNGQQGQGQDTPAEWAVVLIDSEQDEKIDQIVGFLGLDTGADSLMKLPIAEVTGGSLEFGNITREADGSAVSSTSLSDEASKFGVELAMLGEMASTDNVTKALKNVYANTSADGQTYYRVDPFFIYKASVDGAKNAFSSPGALTYTSNDSSDFKYGFYFKAKDPTRATFDEVCNGTKVLTLAPPSDLVKNATTYNSSNPITSAGSTMNDQGGGMYSCSVGEFFMQGSAGQQDYSFNFGGGGYEGNILPGKWRMAINSEEVAVFDLEAFRPVSTDGKPLVYVPTLQVSTDGSDTITNMEMKFHYWDRNSSSYQEVTDLSVLQNTISELALTIYDSNGVNNGCMTPRIEERLTWTVPSTGNIYSHDGFPDGVWLFGTSSSNTAKVANNITVTYKIAGMVLHFTFLPNAPTPCS